MSIQSVDESDVLVSSLQDVIARGGASWRNAPGLIKRICREGRWKHRYCEALHKNVGFETFEAFVAAQLVEGLETDMATLKRLCSDDKEALDLIDQAVQNPTGVNNVNTPRPQGNSEQAAIRRLRKDRPDLLEKVKQGEMSAHAAMVKAGFRKRQIAVTNDPALAAATLRRHFQGDRLRELIEALGG